MAGYSCSSETATDLFSEIDPAYVSLVYSALQELAGISFAFVKVIHDGWDEAFSNLPGAQSKTFLNNTFPSLLRKVKNLAQVADSKLLADLPSNLPPLSTCPSKSKAANGTKASDKFNCSFAMFVELLATFIDSFFVVLDCNLLTSEALSDISKQENAGCHIIAYCLYAARMWSNLPIQHVVCLNRSCLQVVKLLRSALQSPTMTAIKFMTTGKSSVANLACQFVAAFESLASSVIEIKSKQGHLLQLGKLRESILSVAENYNRTAGPPCEPIDADAQRKRSLPTELLRNLSSYPEVMNQPIRNRTDSKGSTSSPIIQSRSSIDRDDMNELLFENQGMKTEIGGEDVAFKKELNRLKYYEIKCYESRKKLETRKENAADKTLAECRAELGAEVDRREVVERELESLNSKLKVKLEEAYKQTGNRDDFFIAAGSTIDEIKSRMEILFALVDVLLKNRKTNDEGVSRTNDDDGVRPSESPEREEGLYQTFESELLVESLNLAQPPTFEQVESSLMAADEPLPSENRRVSSAFNRCQSTVVACDKSIQVAMKHHQRRNQSSRRYFDESCQRCINENCPACRDGFVFIPVNIRYHNSYCSCIICQQNQVQKSRQDSQW